MQFLFRQLMTSYTLRFFLNQPPNQWLTGNKEGKTNIQKFEYLENEKSFLDEIKNIFQFLKGHDLVKKKKFDKKIADTSFNQSPQGHFSE